MVEERKKRNESEEEDGDFIETELGEGHPSEEGCGTGRATNTRGGIKKADLEGWGFDRPDPGPRHASG